MNAMTAEDYKETYWPRLEKAVEQLLTQSPVKYSSISYEQIYRLVIFSFFYVAETLHTNPAMYNI